MCITPDGGSLPVLSHKGRLALTPTRAKVSAWWREKGRRNSPDESGENSTPHDWTLRHIDAPQRTWPRYPVPSLARTTGVPRDSPAVGCRFRWGAPLRPGSSGLYGHSIRTPSACQASVWKSWSLQEAANRGWMTIGRPRDPRRNAFTTSQKVFCPPTRRWAREHSLLLTHGEPGEGRVFAVAPTARPPSGRYRGGFSHR